MSHLARAENPTTGAEVVQQVDAAIDALALQRRAATRVLLTPRAAALVATWLGLGFAEAMEFAANGSLLGCRVLVVEGSDDRPLVLP